MSKLTVAAMWHVCQGYPVRLSASGCSGNSELEGQWCFLRLDPDRSEKRAVLISIISTNAHWWGRVLPLFGTLDHWITVGKRYSNIFKNIKANSSSYKKSQCLHWPSRKGRTAVLKVSSEKPRIVECRKLNLSVSERWRAEPTLLGL